MTLTLTLGPHLPPDLRLVLRRAAPGKQTDDASGRNLSLSDLPPHGPA